MTALAGDICHSRRVTASEVERRVRQLCDGGDARGAATIAIQGLGPELLGFLVVMMGDEHDAGDVFADLCVRIWRGLPGFRWDSSLRTWTYVLARRACYAFRRTRAAHPGQVRFSQISELDELIVRVRTTTLAGLREHRQTRAERLRARLAPDEQALLTLRIDRELEWRDIARVLAGEDADDPGELDDAELTRTAAALRKKFERLKDKLRRLATELRE